MQFQNSGSRGSWCLRPEEPTKYWYYLHLNALMLIKKKQVFYSMTSELMEIYLLFRSKLTSRGGGLIWAKIVLRYLWTPNWFFLQNVAFYSRLSLFATQMPRKNPAFPKICFRYWKQVLLYLQSRSEVSNKLRYTPSVFSSFLKISKTNMVSDRDMESTYIVGSRGASQLGGIF